MRRRGAFPFLLPATGACIVALVCMAFVGAASAADSVLADEPRPHPRSGFADRVAFQPRSLVELLRWKFEAWRDGLPRPPATPTPRIEPDVGRIKSQTADSVPLLTWVGHATVLAQFDGVSLLTDPMFSERASPVSFVGPKRHVPPGIALSQLPHIDVVLISHNHYDHLDEPSVRALARQPGGPPLFVVPLGLGDWMAQRGIVSVVELDWWQSRVIPTARGPVDIVLTPVKHWSARGIGDRLDTLWGGYAVFAPGLHFYFAGDTGYSKDFADVRQRFADRPGGGGFDIALVPIGAYEPRWFMSN